MHCTTGVQWSLIISSTNNFYLLCLPMSAQLEDKANTYWERRLISSQLKNQHLEFGPQRFGVEYQILRDNKNVFAECIDFKCKPGTWQFKDQLWVAPTSPVILRKQYFPFQTRRANILFRENLSGT